MRLIIASGLALAVGVMPLTAAELVPVAAPPLVPSWTAFYVGGHAGALWGNTDWQFPTAGNPFQTQTSGFLGGGQIGANYQLPGLPLVVGVEGEISAASASGTNFVSSTPRLLTAVTGRVGFVSNATTLLFVKAGPAWLRTNYESGSLGSVFVSPRSTFNPTFSDTKIGVLVGVGAEFLMSPNWSAKIEYDYLDFGSSAVAFGNPNPPFNLEYTYLARQRDHVMKVGVNYLFGAR